MSTATQDRKLTDDEAAEYIGVAPITIRKWRSTGRYCIPYLRIGRLVRYRQSDLDAFLESRMVRPGEPD